MTIVDLHTHFDWNEVRFMNLDDYDEEAQSYKHCIYKKDGRLVTVPKIDGHLKTELVQKMCVLLDIPLPNAIEVALQQSNSTKNAQ